MRKYNAGSSCPKCTGTLQAWPTEASEIVVCTRNGTHAFDRNPEQPTTPRPKKGHWPKPVRQTVIKP